MGLVQGRLSLKRRKILRQPKRLNLAKLNDLFLKFRSGPMRLDGAVKEERVGWVLPPIHQGAEAELSANEWDLSHCQVDGDFVLRLRQEKRKVPPALLQTMHQQRLQAEQRKRRGKMLTRQEKRQLRQELVQELMERALPQVAYLEGLWRVTEEDLLIFTTSAKSLALFEKLFYQTFGETLGLQLVPADLTVLPWDQTSGRTSEEVEKLVHQLADVQTFAEVHV